MNFYIQAPAWFSYFAVGIGSAMANSLMLVVYAAADDQRMLQISPLFPSAPGSTLLTFANADITVSPRLGT